MRTSPWGSVAASSEGGGQGGSRRDGLLHLEMEEGMEWRGLGEDWDREGREEGGEGREGREEHGRGEGEERGAGPQRVCTRQSRAFRGDMINTPRTASASLVLF